MMMFDLPNDSRASAVPDRQLSRPPFSVRSLADRWECSEGLIRKMIRNGTLQSFTIGTLIRIPVSEVERIECKSDPAPAVGKESSNAK
ncbi:MAG: hypothetical protein KYX66_06775 [Blastomonas fulva]|uniref:hypothetical protein n=1 Tax=Blastomonas fulva TaxID=1550728 RepID=UPI0024E19C44|nr:hypothetical protein [Blastomonas fulva]MDK2756423.1 hypothetical protein [Blastomonas fulva]